VEGYSPNTFFQKTMFGSILLKDGKGFVEASAKVARRNKPVRRINEISGNVALV
jgi:hypothetical protein